MQSNEKLPPVFLAIGGLRGALELHANALEGVIDEVGIIQGRAVHRVPREGAARDFLLYYTTKASKTIRAMTVLMDHLFSEEVYPLARCVWEHYLAMACVNFDDRYLDEFLMKPLGLYAGVFEHPITKKGSVVRRGILHPQSGARLRGIASIRQLAEASPYKQDLPLHDILYQFLSEHSHPTMLASNFYWDESSTRFSYSERRGLLQSAFLACLVSALTVLEVRRIARIPRKLRELLGVAHEASNEALDDALDQIVMVARFQELPRLVRERLVARRRRKH